MRKVIVLALVVMANVVLAASVMSQSATKEECIAKCKEAAQLITEKGMGIAEHVVVKKESRVEILEASGEQVWEEADERIGLGVGEDLWLKVRLDGKEGWIHTQEDFNAIGLPRAG